MNSSWSTAYNERLCTSPIKRHVAVCPSPAKPSQSQHSEKWHFLEFGIPAKGLSFAEPKHWQMPRSRCTSTRASPDVDSEAPQVYRLPDGFIGSDKEYSDQHLSHGPGFLNPGICVIIFN